MKNILSISIETVSGNVHKFFYNGSLETLQSELNDTITTCNKYGDETKVIKSFNPDKVAAITAVEVEAEIVKDEMKWYDSKTSQKEDLDEGIV